MPACFLLNLTGCGFGGSLTGVNPAHRHLPSPQAGDEPVPPDQQRPALVIDTDRAGGCSHAEQPVVKMLAAGQFDVSGADFKPLVFVERPFGADHPFHERHATEAAVSACTRPARSSHGAACG